MKIHEYGGRTHGVLLLAARLRRLADPFLVRRLALERAQGVLQLGLGLRRLRRHAHVLALQVACAPKQSHAKNVIVGRIKQFLT